MARASTTEKADRTGETLQMKNFDVDIIETRLEQGQIDDNTVLRLVERFLGEGTIGVTYEVVMKSNRHPHNHYCPLRTRRTLVLITGRPPPHPQKRKQADKLTHNQTN